MYTTEFVPDPEQINKPPPLGAALKDVVTAATDLIKNETRLARAEIAESAKRTGEFAKMAAMAGALVLLSAIPLMGFLILLLGEWWDGRYWLSSFVVGAAMACAGAAVFVSAKKSVEKAGLKATRHSLEDAVETVQSKLNEMKQSTLGGMHGIRSNP